MCIYDLMGLHEFTVIVKIDKSIKNNNNKKHNSLALLFRNYIIYCFPSLYASSILIVSGKKPYNKKNPKSVQVLCWTKTCLLAQSMLLRNPSFQVVPIIQSLSIPGYSGAYVKKLGMEFDWIKGWLDSIKKIPPCPSKKENKKRKINTKKKVFS